MRINRGFWIRSRVLWPVMMIGFCTAAICLWAAPHGIEINRPAEAGDPCVIASPAADFNSERGVVDAACGLIDEGKFDEAGKCIDESGWLKKGSEQVSELNDIVAQWQQMQKDRQTQKEAAYKKQLAELERIKTRMTPVPMRWDVLEDMEVFVQRWLEDVGSRAGNDANEQEEPSGGPVAILAAVTRTIEFADEEQKKELLSDPCWLDAIVKAKADAAGYERRGKWLDAYLACYSWLTSLEPNNKTYKDKSDDLIERAEIAGSFQDSPCETGKQRLEGVKRRIFVRAVDELSFRYISKIDYREMASKGVRRCKLLADVVGTLTSLRDTNTAGTLIPDTEDDSDIIEERKTEPNNRVAALGESFKDFKPDTNAIAAFGLAMVSLENEINSWPENGSKDSFISAFEKVLELNLTTARMPEGVVIAQFSEASFLTLDPYTVLVWPRDVSEFEQQMTNEFPGIGVEISRQNGQLTIGSLLPDTPAYNSGLDAGDVIEKVDGMPTKDVPLSCVVSRIKGPAGTKVTLTIRRNGKGQTRDITLTRAKIVVPTLRGLQRTGEGKWLRMVDEQDKIGYVRLTSFAETTASDTEAALKSLEDAGMRGLILDLRFNPGGYFDSAVAVADEFLDDGLIVITRSRFGTPEYKTARSRGTHPNYPMVVLINSGSASASEIVAGALADPSHKRATLVGERTHGKGVVQGISTYPGEGSQLKYTMANWYLPSGQKIKSQEEAKKENKNDWGVGPDVAVPSLRSDEFRKMFELQRDNDVLVNAGHDDANSPLKKHTIAQTIEVDPQLTTAILVVKSKLIREQEDTGKK
ncbi:MAG: S41 family peptidase [Sedimentisphaerales bacterium]